MIKRNSITKLNTNNKKQRAEAKGTRIKKKSAIHHVAEKIIRSLPHKQTSEIPTRIKPMLATKIDEPFNDKDWIFEVKWDGYRCISYLNNGKADLRSRSNISFNKVYTPVLDALKEWDISAVVDGEIIVVNDQGKSDFEALQKWQQTKEGVLIYYVFDILWLNEIDLTSLPLSQRKDILKKLVPEKSTIKFSDSIEEYGIDFYDIAKSNDLEGIVGKKKDSSYEPGKRTSNWLKIPAQVRQEFVIGGWTESSSSRSFKSLLFGYYVKGKLHYVGHAGGGFKESEMPAILKKLKKYSASKSPFVNDTDVDDIVHWLKPALVAEIKYASFTSAGKIRKPAIFLGFREDKKATEVIQEINISPKIVQKESKTEKHDIDNNWQMLEKQKITSSGKFTVDGQNLTLTNVEKQLWKGITKADLVQYYNAVSSYILPHLKQRPLSLHIKHLSPTAPGFYIKDMEGHAPEWAEIFSIERKHKKEGKRNIIDYLICNNTATLLYIINLGCIDVNPWTSHIPSFQKPDFIIIDLDPSDEDFNKVITVASAAKEFFEKRKIAAYPKTSGKTGLHMYLPCSAFNFMESRAIAERICEEIHNLVPRISTTEVNVAERGDKLYIDPGQNDFADTVASAYSVRPFKEPIVSTPLTWNEIKPGLDPHMFTIRTILHRLKKHGDIFSPVLSSAVQKKNNKLLKMFLD